MQFFFSTNSQVLPHHLSVIMSHSMRRSLPFMLPLSLSFLLLLLYVNFPPSCPSPTFILTIDAGSSGSRLQIYHSTATDNLPLVNPLQTLKVEPGLSSFIDNLQGLESHLLQLLVFAMNNIPTSHHSTTPVYIYATAGMRLLETQQQQKILEEVCHILLAYPFALPKGCDYHVRVINGSMEGIYAWTSVNYLSNSLTNNTLGVLDMGGASTQMTFVPSPHHALLLWDELETVHISGRMFKLFVKTFLGYGTNEARKRYIELYDSNTNDVSDPCLPFGYKEVDGRVMLSGSGDFLECKNKTQSLLQKGTCKIRRDDAEICLLDGVAVPLIPNDMKFVGISDYYYTTHELTPDTVFSFSSFYGNAVHFCHKEFNALRSLYSRVTTEKRLSMQCFKSSWVMNVLEIIGLGEGRFQPVGVIGGKEVSWTLGVVLMEEWVCRRWGKEVVGGIVLLFGLGVMVWKWRRQEYSKMQEMEEIV